MIYLKGSGGDKYYSELYNGIVFACISLEDGLKSVICHNLEINKEYKPLTPLGVISFHNKNTTNNQQKN